jgi:hypothetical protein
MRLTMLMVLLLLCQAAPATRAVTTPAAHAESQAFATSSRGQLVAKPELIAGAWEIGRPAALTGSSCRSALMCRTWQISRGHQVKMCTYASTIARRATKPAMVHRRDQRGT